MRRKRAKGRARLYGVRSKTPLDIRVLSDRGSRYSSAGLGTHPTKKILEPGDSNGL